MIVVAVIERYCCRVQPLPRMVRAWARCYIASMALYLCTGGAWAYYIYTVFGRSFFKDGKMPGTADMMEQIKVRS